MIMGEDIAEQGGIFACTKGLLDQFGSKRVRNTPISEKRFGGRGSGRCLRRTCVPIVELMYMDFVYVCMDQLLNQAAKIRYMFGGKAKVPLVVRGQQGIGQRQCGPAFAIC